MRLSFRPIDESDRDFLRSVYASTREEELTLVDWDEAQKAAFIEMQFSAQHQYYKENYFDTEFLIILQNDVPIGRVYIARWPQEIRIVDLAILPQHRNAGYGTTLLKSLLDEAKATGKPVNIHVERYNPALNLYRRLGFEKKGEHGLYEFMEWRASTD